MIWPEVKIIERDYLQKAKQQKNPTSTRTEQYSSRIYEKQVSSLPKSRLKIVLIMQIHEYYKIKILYTA